MKCVLISVGDELLIGQVTDTNVVWIATELNGIGVPVEEMVTVKDEAGPITEALDRYMGRYDLVIMTGGLGPTNDDITKQTLADYFGSPLVTIPEVVERIRAYFTARGRSLIESNLRQADVPEACEVMMNEHGTAPGMWFERDGTILVSLPGVPYEMMGLMETSVLPRIRQRVKVPGIIHRTIMTQGVPESYLALLLKDWEAGLPECVKLAYLPRPGIVRLRLTLTGKCASESREMLEVIEGKLLHIIPQHIFGYDDVSLEQVLGELLLGKGLTVATAESCTGGNIAHLITSVPGSSRYFTGSVIAYHNRVKTEVLNVEESVMEHLGTRTAIATSGIAGPDGGTEDKPVGTTWIAVRYDDRTIARKYNFGGTRDRVITQASYTALQLLRRLILDQI
jgi:nicotinamide-nucleotide amidase